MSTPERLELVNWLMRAVHEMDRQNPGISKDSPIWRHYARQIAAGTPSETDWDAVARVMFHSDERVYTKIPEQRPERPAVVRRGPRSPWAMT